MSDRIFYTMVVAGTSGIFIRSFFVIEIPVILLILLLALALACLYRWYESPRQHIVLYVVVALAACAIGMFRLSFADETWPLLHLPGAGAEFSFIGEVIREPEERERTLHLYVRAHEHVFLVIADRYTEVEYGDVVAIEGELHIPKSFESELGRTFNYPGYLKARGVQYMMTYPDSLEVLQHGEGNVVVSALLSFKHVFQNSLQSVLPEPHVGLAEGLLLGEKRALGEELTDVFRRAGIIHIVVLSGYNVMLVVGFFLFVLGFLLPRRSRMIGGLIAITLFALLVGLSATVVRASVMAALFLIAFGLGRQYAVLRALCLAGVVMLLINPYLLVYDIGFQLSFLATLGLVLVAPQLEMWVVEHKQLLFLRALVVTTIATQIAVLPLLLYQMGEVSLVSVFVNVLVLPMVPIAMMLTFLTGIVSMISTGIGSIAAYFTYLSLSYILIVANVSAGLPFAALSVPQFEFWLVPLGYLSIAFLWWRYKMYQRKKNEPLAGWIIEEEKEKAVESPKLTTTSSETPIFFR